MGHQLPMIYFSKIIFHLASFVQEKHTLNEFNYRYIPFKSFQIDSVDKILTKTYLLNLVLGFEVLLSLHSYAEVCTKGNLVLTPQSIFRKKKMFLQQKISFQAFFHIEKERERVGVYKCEKSQFMNGHVLQQNNLLPLINSISCLTLSAGAVKRRPSQRIVVLPQFLKTCCVLHKPVLFLVGHAIL